MADETTPLPDPTANLFAETAESACGKLMTHEAEKWWQAWTAGRKANFDEHWEEKGQLLLVTLRGAGSQLAEFIGDKPECGAGDLKRWEDHLTGQGWRPDGSFRPTPFCIAQPPK